MPLNVPLHQLRVEMLHREVPVASPEQSQHPRNLLGRRPMARRLAKPPVRQSRLALLRKPVPPAPERPLVNAQHLSRISLCDLAPLLAVQHALKTHPAQSLVKCCPVHRGPLCSGHPRTGQLTSYKHRTDHELATLLGRTATIGIALMLAWVNSRTSAALA